MLRGVDGARFASSIRALRQHRGWRQDDLAREAGVSRAVVAAIEQGRGDRVTLRTLGRIADALGSRVTCRIEWRGDALDRLIDADHAALVEQIVRRLTRLGWTCATEVSFNVFGERGSIDVLGTHSAGAILVVEAKTSIPDVGRMLMTLDRKRRLAPRLATERGVAARYVGRLLVVRDSGTSRRRVTMHASTFASAFPLRGPAMTHWLRGPEGEAAGIWFLPLDAHAVVKRRSRVRRRHVERAGRTIPAARLPECRAAEFRSLATL
jgi:transcriptional regulator with XRE-family HTH domain